MGLGKGILAMGALAAGAAALMFGGKEAKAAETPQTPSAASAPPQIAARMVAALATGDPNQARQEAARLKQEGFALQAADLERAANTMAQVRSTLETAPPLNQPVQVSPPISKPAVQPPPAAVPATLDRSQVSTTSPGLGTPFSSLPQVNLPPETITSAGAPPIPGVSIATAVPAAEKLLASQTANMLRNARKGTENKALVMAYQTQEQPDAGKIDGKYGSKTGKTFLRHGIVPPKPLYFSATNPSADKAAWKALMFSMAAKDPQRAEEYIQSSQV